MKKILQYLSLPLGICLTAGHVCAAAKTNLVQYLNLRGTLYYQAGPVTNASGTTVYMSTVRTPITSATLIGYFGEAASVSFSSEAKLVMISQLDSDSVKVVVQDGTNRVNVTSYFDLNFQNDPTIETSAERLDNGAVTATRYQLLKLKLHESGNFSNLPIRFEVAGFSTIKRKTIFLDGSAYFVDRPSAKMAGDGTSKKVGGGDADFLAQMTLTVVGGSVEVVP